MTHSHLTQWIEDADAQQFCQAESWSRIADMTKNHRRDLREAILKMPAGIGNYALACARHLSSVKRDASLDRL
jgi:hypothetical protein